MNTFGYGKLRVIAERVFTAPTAMVLKGIFTPTTRTLVSSVTFLRSHGGAAYAMSIAVLSLVVIGALVQTTGSSIA